MTVTQSHLMRIITVVLLGYALPQAVNAWSLFGPKNYSDCILEKVKDASNTAAVAVVSQACRQLFPIKRVNLPTSAVKNLSFSDAKFSNRGLEITINNNNHEWTVTGFELAFIETAGKAGTVIAQLTVPIEGTEALMYGIEETINPYEKYHVTLGGSLDPNKAYKLFITDIKGYQ